MSMTVNEMVRRARKHAENGEIAEARRLFEEVLEKFPANRRATEGLRALGAGPKTGSAATVNPFLKEAKGNNPGTEKGGGGRSPFGRRSLTKADFAGGVSSNRVAQGSSKANPKAQVDELIAMLNAGRAAEVTAKGVKLAKKLPQIPVIPAVMGVAFAQQQMFDQAIRHYKKSLAIAPGDANVLNNLGIAYYSLGRHDEAIKTYREALKRQPGFLMAWLNLGNALHAKGDHEEAFESFNRAIAASPRFVHAYNALGMAYQDVGRFEDAEAAYRKAIDIDPNFAVAHNNFSMIHKYETAEDPHLVQLETLVKKPNQSAETVEFLNFALGKAFDDLGEYDKAFPYFKAGNQARKSTQPYRMEDEFHRMQKICEIFDTPPEPLKVNETRSPVPVFVVSMPRSGSTLVEQILAAHSKVFAGGEIETMRRIGETLDWGRFQPTPATLEKVREEYFSCLPDVTGGEAFVTDKMPANFQYLPLIFACFPEAKVIHVMRDPRASCWSMYRHRFASLGTGYTYDLDDLTDYYSRYLDMMDFCRDRYLDRILDVRYEALTEDQEAESRRLVAFAGLDWEPQCLEFHKANTIVKTTSLQQVRRKIYKGSSEAWRNYETHLARMVERLAPALERVG